MKEFLQFLYFGEGTLTMDNVAEIMNLAEKYEITEGTLHCEEFMKKKI